MTTYKCVISDTCLTVICYLYNVFLCFLPENIYFRRCTPEQSLPSPTSNVPPNHLFLRTIKSSFKGRVYDFSITYFVNISVQNGILSSNRMKQITKNDTFCKIRKHVYTILTH